MSGRFADDQHVFVAFGIHAHGADHYVVAKRHAVHVDDDQLQLIEPSAEEYFDPLLVTGSEA